MNQVQNELAHYGVLGMKWGTIRQKQVKNLVSRSKRSIQKGISDQNNFVKESKRDLKRKDSDLDAEENKFRIQSGKQMIAKYQDLNKKLSTIDVDNVSFRSAKKQVLEIMKQY